MITNSSNFIGKYGLPQTGNPEGVTLLDRSINTYEKEYLLKVLGPELWEAFTSDLEDSGSGSPDPRFNKLLQSSVFDYHGQKYYWKGFEDPESPITAYVFYKFLEEEAQATTLVGQVLPSTDNSTRYNPVKKMIKAWNEMVKDNEILQKLLWANINDYQDWDRNQELLTRKNYLDL